MPKCNFKLEKSLLEEETGEKRPMVLTDAIEAVECTWVRELEGADKVPMLHAKFLFEQALKKGGLRELKL